MEKSGQKRGNCAALILAAGYSGRMGVPKGFLPFDENRTFLEKITSEYLAFGCSPVAIVMKAKDLVIYEKMHFKQKDKIQAVLNPAPEKERFFSLQTGLKAIKPTGAVFLHNVDNPFLEQELLQVLGAAFKEHTSLAQASACAQTFFTPTYHGEGGHPILLSQEIVKALIETPDYKQNLKIFLQSWSQINVPVNDPNILANINSPEEYERYFGMKNDE